MNFEIQGHRGARGMRPENTLEAFEYALDQGVTTLELDVVISKDHQVVVSHEPFFNPEISLYPDGTPVKTEREVNVYLLDYKEIKQFDVGSKGHARFPEQQKIKTRKPLLQEVLLLAKNYAKKHKKPLCKFNIEIKSEAKEYGISQPEPSVFTDLVYAEIIKNIDTKYITLQSFDFQVLKIWKENILKNKYKKTLISALVEPTENQDLDVQLGLLGFVPDIWSPYFKVLTPNSIAAIHKKNMKVIPWTVNEVPDMQNMKNWGCDGLITDYPNRAVGL